MLQMVQVDIIKSDSLILLSNPAMKYVSHFISSISHQIAFFQCFKIRLGQAQGLAHICIH